MKKIILASASPRRKQLLEQIKLPFVIETSNYEEVLDTTLLPHILAETLSKHKAQAVAKNHTDAIIIAADTIIVVNGIIIGKPKSKEDASSILQLLSGNSHTVITGFTIIDTDTSKTVTRSIESKVFMRKITKSEIDSYIKTKEPMDKAGAYGMQERGGIFIERIEGDALNVIGLPICSLTQELKKFGIFVL